jgi:hypothetical protein
MEQAKDFSLLEEPEKNPKNGRMAPVFCIQRLL